MVSQDKSPIRKDLVKWWREYRIWFKGSSFRQKIGILAVCVFIVLPLLIPLALWSVAYLAFIDARFRLRLLFDRIVCAVTPSPIKKRREFERETKLFGFAEQMSLAAQNKEADSAVITKRLKLGKHAEQRAIKLREKRLRFEADRA